MKQTKLTDALFHADTAELDRIAALCEPDWVPERVFERAYRKYQGEAVKPIPRVQHREWLRIAVTAACLLLTVSGMGTIWYLRVSAPEPQMRLPQEVTTVTETTAPQPSETAPEPTSAPTSPETVPMVLETVTETTGSIPATELVTSELPETADIPEETDQTVPPVQTEAVTQPAAIPTEQTVPVTEEMTPPSTESPTDPLSEDLPPGSEPGSDAPHFVETVSGTYHTIVSAGSSDISLEDTEFSLSLENYTMEEIAIEGRCRRFLLIERGNTFDFSVLHFPYGEFSFTWQTDLHTAEPVTVGGREGYLIVNTENGICNLIWDDGAGIALISGEQYLEFKLFEIAGSFLCTP